VTTKSPAEKYGANGEYADEEYNPEELFNQP
jgi:hypothetical protein